MIKETFRIKRLKTSYSGWCPNQNLCNDSTTFRRILSVRTVSLCGNFSLIYGIKRCEGCECVCLAGPWPEDGTVHWGGGQVPALPTQPVLTGAQLIPFVMVLFFTNVIHVRGWGNNQDPDSGWTSRIIFLESLETIFRVKNSLMRIRNLFDPGSGMENLDLG